MASRKTDELAEDLDDAKTALEDLRTTSDVDTADKLDELDQAIERARDKVGDLEDAGE